MGATDSGGNDRLRTAEAARRRKVRVWLFALVTVSAAVRILIGSRLVAPWIMVDELVYSELGKSVGEQGRLLVRGVSSTGYGFVYPALIAPAWRLFGPMPAVYAEAKAINAVLMSLAAIPAYFLARRLLSTRLALVAAMLTVLVPSMLYTSTLMTENAFYPIFLAFVLLLVVTLERPTPLRQIALVAVFLIAFETRAEAIALVPAMVVAPLALAVVERRGFRPGLRPFATLYGIFIAGAAAALLVTSAHGRSPLSLLGAYHAATSSTYTVGRVLHFLVYHVAELDLYVGIVPFAALVAIWLTPRSGTPARRAFAVASLAVGVALAAEVSVFASQMSVNRIEERNLFYLTPLALIALLGLAADGIVPTARRPVLTGAAVAIALPVFIPFTRFITTSAVSDTFALLPWWWVQDHWIAVSDVRWAVLAAAMAAGALFVFLPRDRAIWLATLVGAYFVVTAVVAENGRHGIERSSAASFWVGVRKAHPDWVDRRVGGHAKVAVLWTGATTAYPVWENEFFNRSLGTVYDVDGAARPDPLPETDAITGPSGRLLSSSGAMINARYVLAPESSEIRGALLARDPTGVDLYRVAGPIVILSNVTGLYPADTWSGRDVSYKRFRCTGGSLAVKISSDDSLFTDVQTVVAHEAGRVVGRTSIDPAAQSTLVVPLVRGRNGVCAVRFAVGRTVIPARAKPGSFDDRRLGAHFLGFQYHS